MTVFDTLSQLRFGQKQAQRRQQIAERLRAEANARAAKNRENMGAAGRFGSPESLQAYQSAYRTVATALNSNPMGDDTTN